MKNIVKTNFVLLFVVHSIGLFSQNTLSLDQAKAQTLEHNFAIKIAKNTVKTAENNTDKRLFGYLPSVGFSAGLSENFGGSNQAFSNGNEVNVSNAFTWGGNASLSANYLAFDKKRELRKTQADDRLQISNLQLRQNVEQNLAQMYNAFFQVASLEENVKTIRKSIEVSQDRINRAKIKLDYGQGNSLDLLNAQVDIKRDSVNLLNALQGLLQAKRNLNTLMGSTQSTDFQVDTTVLFQNDLSLQSLIESAKIQNIDLLINQQNQRLGKTNLELVRAEQKPTLSAGAAYDFTYSDNPDMAFITSNNSRGLAANVGLSWSIFDGGSRKVRAQSAILDLENTRLQKEQLLLNLETSIRNAWGAYQNALFVLKVENSAVETAQINFDRTQERIKAGQLTSIEFRQAQLNLLNSQVSLTTAKYTAKVQELELLRLAGLILK